MAQGDAITQSELERRLVDAALDGLRRAPAEQLSIRQVANEVGVSHQAPYVHFRNRRRFLAAVAGAGLAAAVADARNAVAEAGPDPLARMLALAGAYMAFIEDDPHVHDLAYGPLVAMRDHHALQTAAIEYWTLMHEVVGACQPPGTADDEIQRRSATAWGVVYGIARLDAHGKIPRAVVPASAAELVEVALRSLYAGWNHADR